MLYGLPDAGKGREVSPTEISGATTVDPVAAKALLDRGVTFIDVRGDGSWNNGHIPGAVHLDLKSGFTKAALAPLAARGKEIVIYCTGFR